MHTLLCGVLLSLFFLPSMASAEFYISEIMYDLQGGDDGREWIEVVNTDGTTLDLSTYKFREGETNHALTLYQGDATVSTGGYAIIADDPAKFLLDHPGSSVTIFDSSFSLSNTGEMLTLRNAEAADIDSVSYSSEQGATGDGNSLQKNGSAWSLGLPSPGSAFSGEVATAASNPPTSGTAATVTSTSGGGATAAEPQITADAGPDRSAVVGVETVFEGIVYGVDKKPIENVRLSWNFGDGSTAEGKKVLHAFRYPGTYVVALSAAAVKVGVGDYVTVVAYEPSIRLTVTSGKDGYAEIENAGGQRLDLSLWQLREGTAFFMFPEGTHILPKNKVRFAHAITGLAGAPTLTLTYPNGMPASLLAATPITPVVTKTTSAPKAPARQQVTAAVVLVQKDTDRPTARVVTATSTTSHFWSAYGWYAALAGLILVGGVGMVLLRRREETKSLADEFEIVE